MKRETTFTYGEPMTKRLLGDALEEASHMGYSDPDEEVHVWQDKEGWTIRFGGER